MSIYVSVTKDHIKRGKKISTCNCPIALAIKDAFKVNSGVYASHENILDYSKDRFNPIRYVTTKAMSNFMQTFDSGKKVNPFSFQLLLEGERNA